MKKIYMQMAVTASLSLFVSGCLEPTSRSMGATLMPAPLMHRASADSSSSEKSVTASGFWGHTGDDYNVKDLNAGGGNVGFTYRMGGALSPFFVNIAAGGFGGSLKFGCDEGSKCNPSSLTKTENTVPLDGDAKYAAWLRSDAGKESYSFWNIQERILAGVDFNLGAYVILGFAGGAQLFQGASDYDDAREKLDDLRIVDDRGPLSRPPTGWVCILADTDSMATWSRSMTSCIRGVPTTGHLRSSLPMRIRQGFSQVSRTII